MAVISCSTMERGSCFIDSTLIATSLPEDTSKASHTSPNPPLPSDFFNRYLDSNWERGISPVVHAVARLRASLPLSQFLHTYRPAPTEIGTAARATLGAHAAKVAFPAPAGGVQRCRRRADRSNLGVAARRSSWAFVLGRMAPSALDERGL